jgi:ferredoxin
MPVRANPSLVDDLERFGAKGVEQCFHCGNCTATCPLSEDDVAFPRRTMRQVQLGLEPRLRAGLEPWLCYYCGDCSAQCPRAAEPAETMMSVRRWLTAQYDFTGLAGRLYRSAKAEVAAVVAVALLTGAGFLAYGFGHGGSLAVYDGPGAFLPSEAVHRFDWAMGAVLLALLLGNCARMWRFTMRGPGAVPVPAAAYLRRLALLPVHFFTQRRWSRCEDRRPWAQHLVLMLSYVTMLVLIMFFLREVQHGPEIRWEVHVFGYLASAGLLVTAVLAVRGRLRRSAPHHRLSHETDWAFLVLLLYVVSTGVVQHVLHRAGLPAAANLAYVAHLMGVVPMLVLEVPFGKWSHLAYRPLATYFATLPAEARAAEAPPRAAPAHAPQPAA